MAKTFCPTNVTTTGVALTPPPFSLRLKLRQKRRPRHQHSLLPRPRRALKTLGTRIQTATATLPSIITAPAILPPAARADTTTILRIIAGDRLGHLKDHRLLTQPTDVLLLIQACLQDSQVRPVILPIQATVATHHHPTIDPMLDPTPAAVEDTLHLRIPQHRDRVGHPIRVTGRHPPMVALHPQTMRRPQERITDRVTMVRDLVDPVIPRVAPKVIHRVGPNLGPHRPPLVHRLLRQRPAVVVLPMLLVAHLQTKINMDNSRHITISIRVMAPAVHQVPLQVGLQDHQLRKAIQSGQRDLNHSLHRGLPGRVAHLPVLIPILDRGLPCIQGVLLAAGKTDIHHKVEGIP